MNFIYQSFELRTICTRGDGSDFKLKKAINIKPMYENLQEFLDFLFLKKEIKVVNRRVSTRLEISKITSKESKRPFGGKALFFKNVKDSFYPVITNVFGSSRRMAYALGMKSLNHISQLLEKHIKQIDIKTNQDALELLSAIIKKTDYAPQLIKKNVPICQEVINTGDNVNLYDIPTLFNLKKDGGNLITLPVVFTKDPDTGARNTGIYRMQIYDKKTTGMHWYNHNNGSHLYSKYGAKKKKMPVACVLGADPATIFAAMCPLPEGVDELLLSGFIRKKPVPLTKCITIDMEVPSDAEFVLEGYINYGDLKKEGPFGNHTGYYGPCEPYPVFHVTAQTHRKNPVYQATIVGRPPMEDCYMAKAMEKLLYPVVKASIPGFYNIRSPFEGIFHNISYISVDKTTANPKKIISNYFKLKHIRQSRGIILLDKNTDIDNDNEIVESMLQNFDFNKDILSFFVESVNRNIVALDFTKKKSLPAQNSISPARFFNTSETLPKYLKKANQLFETGYNKKHINHVLSVFEADYTNYQTDKIADLLLFHDNFKTFNIIIIFDNNIDSNDHYLLLWKFFNNLSFGQDIIIKNSRMVIDVRAAKKNRGLDF